MGGTYNEGVPEPGEGPGPPGQLESSFGLLEELLGGAQAQLSSIQVVGQAGGSAVRVTMDGEQNVLAVQLDPEAVRSDQVEWLEDMIVTAMADGARQAQEAKLRSVAALAERLGLGGMFEPDDGLPPP